jgi:hypothetical protein
MTALVHPISIFAFPESTPSSASRTASWGTDTDENQGLSSSTSQTSSTALDQDQDRDRDQDRKFSGHERATRREDKVLVVDSPRNLEEEVYAHHSSEMADSPIVGNSLGSEGVGLGLDNGEAYRSDQVETRSDESNRTEPREGNPTRSPESVKHTADSPNNLAAMLMDRETIPAPTATATATSSPIPPLQINPPTPTPDSHPEQFINSSSRPPSISVFTTASASSSTTGLAIEPVSPLSMPSTLPPTPNSEEPPYPTLSTGAELHSQSRSTTPTLSLNPNPNPSLTLTPGSIKSNRRLSRKQAPALTESLENLGLAFGSATTLNLNLGTSGAYAGLDMGTGAGADEWGAWRNSRGYTAGSMIELGAPLGRVRSALPSPSTSTSTSGFGFGSPSGSSAKKTGGYTTTSTRKQEMGERRKSLGPGLGLGLGLGFGLGSNVEGVEGKRRSSEEDEDKVKKGGRRKSGQFLTFAGFGRRKSEMSLKDISSPLSLKQPQQQSPEVLLEDPVRISLEAPRLPPIVIDDARGIKLKILPSAESLPVSPLAASGSTDSSSPPRRQYHQQHLLGVQDRRERRRINPPVIPARIDSLPVDPDSPRAVFLRTTQGDSTEKEQLPLDHFSFGQTEGDAIVKTNEARRPSERTFMTGYSLAGGVDPGTTDDEVLPAGTINLNMDDEEDRRAARPAIIPTSTMTSDDRPVLFTGSSSGTATRPREDLPFGRSRRQIGAVSGASTPSEVPVDGPSTPRAEALTPSSSFRGHTRSRTASPPPFAQYGRSDSKQSMKTVVAKRRPVQWAELDALEAEEARLRAEERREERARRDKEKSEGRSVLLGRRATTKRLKSARGDKSGTSTDTSADDVKLKREGYRERKARLKREAEVFDAMQHTIPGYDDLMAASMIEIRDDQGTKIEFGKLIEGGLGKRYVVIFIRHWYCPLCAQYTESIIRTIDQESLDRANVELIIIGNGSYKMIPGYSKSLKCPFKMYTDSKLRLYKALGMTRQTGDAGAEDEKGDYVRMSNLEGTWQVAKRATKMPLKKPG